MAKVKVSKFAKILKEVRQSNEELRSGAALSGESVSDLQESVNNLERNVLLILEKLRRLERYPMVQTKNGKLISPKTNIDTSIVPSNDENSGDTINDETSRNILLKLYNFMVRNSERQKVKGQKEIDDRKSLEKRKEVNYRKELIGAGLDPKLFKKKKGLLGKIGTGIKWTAYASIGAGLTGLIYLFRDEIKEFALKVKNGFVEMGKTLSSIVSDVKNFYNNHIKKYVDNILNNPLIKDIIDSKGRIKEIISSYGQLIIGKVSKLLEDFIVSTGDWIQSIIPQIISKVGESLVSLGQSVAGWAKENPGTVAATLGTFFGSGWIKAISAVYGVSKGITAMSGFVKDVRYGEQYENVVKEIVQLHPQYKGKELSSGDLQDFMDNPESIKKIVEGKSPRESDEQYVHRFGQQMSMVKQLPGLQREHLSNILEGSGYSLDVEEDRRVMQMQPDDFSKLGIRPDIKDSTGQHISLTDNEEFYDTILPLYIAKKAEKPLKESITNLAVNAKKSFVDTATKKLQQFEEEHKEQIGEAQQIKQSTQTAIADAKNTVTGVVKSAEETVSVPVKAIREEYSGVETPSQAATATANLVARSGKHVDQNVIRPMMQKASKFTTEDFFDAINKSYDSMEMGVNTLVGTMSELDSWEKMSNFFSKLSPEQKQNNIQQDPNEDPFNLNSLWSQTRDSMSVNNKVMNNKTSSSGIENYAFPLVRMDEPSKKWCVVDSLCKV